MNDSVMRVPVVQVCVGGLDVGSTSSWNRRGGVIARSRQSLVCAKLLDLAFRQQVTAKEVIVRFWDNSIKLSKISISKEYCDEDVHLAFKGGSFATSVCADCGTAMLIQKLFQAMALFNCQSDLEPKNGSLVLNGILGD